MPSSTISALNGPTGFVGEAQNKFNQPTTVRAALLALGIVYGDLGTSPLYTLQTIVHIMGDQFTPDAALGSLSLIFWALIRKRRTNPAFRISLTRENVCPLTGKLRGTHDEGYGSFWS